MAHTLEDSNLAVQTCEVCIIGAGVSGLNALFAAAQYLQPTDKVVLIDRNEEAGGMWTQVYDFCRLHQPHPSFTVGNMNWNWSKPREYLATAHEVKAHLQSCYETLRHSVDVEQLFGHTVTECEEIPARKGAIARVTVHPNGSEGERRIIEARRVIKAYGYDVPQPEPITFESSRIVSTTPQLLGASADLDDRAPIYVVGGGKTGMDTCLAVLDRLPKRPLKLINGTGSVFAERGKFFPRGARRWWDGHMVTRVFRDQAMLFDGTNEDEAFYHFRRNYTVGLAGAQQQFFFGILSEEERRDIANGVDEIFNEYLVDVVDTADGPEMVFRSGERRSVEPGSVFINCTGHLMRHQHADEPYLSEHGAILTITPRSMVHFLSSAAAYFLTHLMFLEKLRDLPLYAFDGETMAAKNNHVYHTSLISLTFMNMVTMMQVLPFAIVNGCGLDFDRLYPLPRRALVLIDIKLRGQRYVSQCRKALDRVSQRFGVRCGRLPTQTGSRSERVGVVDRNKAEAKLQPLSLARQ
ncbi:FAD-dependent oxidoreductase [Hoeflea sp. WL0058]|uniref:FAD-dependent oxidoreductase n=1 Tax=Flavimaribacter sediminis TaxID=2865987 RepID=A0AAE2ZP64_9HYPH|nr:FAD-dependent oxidoreductase [Flavimaribacter sediminis]MBW8640188.1 FAD-dependent oxidoreductase [Flavimaribacter sediminis]